MGLDRVMVFTALLRGRGFELTSQATDPSGTVQHFRNPRTKLSVSVSVDLDRWGHLSFSYVDEERCSRPAGGDPEVIALVRAFLGEGFYGPLTAHRHEVVHFVEASYPWEAVFGR